MSKLHGALIVVIILGGCASPQITGYNHKTADRAQFEQDGRQCIYEAKAATAGYAQGSTARSIGGAIGQGLGEGMQIARRRDELAVSCMEARGYVFRFDK